MMAPTLLDEINQVNIAFLSMLRRMAQRHESQELGRLGFDEAMCKRFEMLSDDQLIRLASSNHVLCRFAIQTSNLLSLLGTPAPARELLNNAALVA
jgi:flagellar transcriptional activator FlhD